MDYCAKIAREVIEWKRIMRAFCGMLVLVFVIGTANELPALDLKEANYGNKILPDTETKLLLDKAMTVESIQNMVLEKIAVSRMPKKSWEIDGINPKNPKIAIGDAVISSSGNEELPENFRTAVNISEDYIDIENRVVEESFGNHIVADIPVDNVMTEQPAEDIMNPSDEVVPIVPNVPAEDIIPGDVTDTEGLPEADNGQAACVQGFLVDDAGMIYGFVPEELEVDSGYLTLPSEGCTGILRGAFQGIGAKITDINIPNNITYIEDGVFADIPELYAIWTGEGNPSYTSVDGVLFDRSMTTILAFPTGWIGVYDMPEYVTRLADASFANTNLEKLQMKNCGIIEVGNAVFGENKGIGIVISVPFDYLEEYQVIFAGYQVSID